MSKKFFAILLALCMVISMMPMASAAGGFTDVAADDWFADEVAYVYAKGLMNGVDSDSFNPDGSVTRAMVWTTLARLDGVDTSKSDPWWLVGQQWAMENGISDGTMAMESVTREQLVTMLYRYVIYKGYEIELGDSDILSYPDVASVSEWAITAMIWAVNEGIINGIGGNLQPQGDANRAQLAAILYRYSEEVLPGLEEEEPEPSPEPSHEPSEKPEHTCVVVSWVVTEPTCTEEGYTTYTSCCGYSFKGNYVDALGHAYGEWEANNDGTHSRVCGNDADHVETAGCADFTYTGKDNETKHIRTCGICGYEVEEYHEYDNYICACGRDITPVAGETVAPVAMIGTTGYASVSAALAAAEDGDTITLLADVATISFTNATADNLTIVGSEDVKVGEVELIKTPNYGAPDGLTLQNITFNGRGVFASGAGNQINDLSVIECRFTEGAMLGMNAEVSVDGLTVQDCNFAATSGESNFYKTHIILQGACENIVISGNTMAGAEYNAIQLSKTLSGEVTISDNTINGTGDRALRLGTIKADAEVTISGNTITSDGDENGELAKATSLADGSSVVLSGNTWNDMTDAEAIAAKKIVGLTYKAMIGTKGYNTLQAAVNAVQNNETIVILPGTYAEVLDVRVGKTFTVKAEEAGTVVIAGINQQSNGDKASTVTFKNLTIDNSEATEGWFTGTAQNIFPCVGAWGGNLSFENCTFEVAGTSGRETGVMTWWTTDKVTLSFNECTFNGIDNHASARAMQIYGNVDLTVTDCEFNTHKDYSLKYVGDEGCTATLSGNKVYNSKNFVQLGSAPYPGDKYTLRLNSNTLGEGVNNFIVDHEENQTIYIDGALLVLTNEALAAAVQNKEPAIALPAGNFTVELYNIDARDSLTIIGQGADTKISFSNQQVRASQFEKELTIKNCNIQKMATKKWGHLVFGSSSTNGVYTIEDCIFNGIGTQGIYINQNVEATYNITGCTFNDDFGGEGAITIQNNPGVNVTVNVTDCTFNDIPTTSHKICTLYANTDMTLNAEGVEVYCANKTPLS